MVIAAVARRLTERGWPLVAAFPAAVGVTEQLFPMLMPYTSAIVLVGAPSLIQLAEIGGVSLVSSWLALVNVALFASAEHAVLGRVRAARYVIVAGAVVLVLTAVVGRARIASVTTASRTAKRIRVGVVQRATPMTDAGDSVDDLREATRELLAQSERERVDLVIWPETAIQVPAAYAGRAREAFFRDTVLRDSRAPPDDPHALGVPLLVGALVVEKAGDGAVPPAMRNAALLVMPSGAVTGDYTKRELAPVGERTPFGDLFPSLREHFPPKVSLRPGTEPDALPFLEHKIGVSICIEDIIGDRIRETALRSQPDLLVNLTSDAWFGTSDAAELHLALASFRAIEHRRELVRVSHDGVTAKVAATGVVDARLPRNRPAQTVWDAHWLSGTTPFDAYGVEGWWLLTALVGIGIFVGFAGGVTRGRVPGGVGGRHPAKRRSARC